jgi:hypothetical protein
MAGCILGGLILLICVLSWTEFITFVLWIVFAVAVLIAVRCGATALLTPNRRFGAVVRVVLCAIIATVVWNFIPSGNNPPPAKPKIVDYTLTTNWFDDNEVAVTLRNDGQDGWVVVRYRTTTTDTDIKRRPGVEVWARHNLTSEDDSEYYLDQHTWTKGVWACCTFLKAGEQKLIQIKLPNHSSWDNQCYPSVTPVLVKPENIEVK